MVMIDLRTDIPVKEDLTKRIQLILSQIRELTLEVEQVLALAIDKHVLLTRKEVAEMLRCEEKKVPRPIPRIRSGRNWLFELADVEAFIASKKKKVV